MLNRLITDFDVEDMLNKIYLLPQTVVNEPYVWSFQYWLLNYVLFTINPRDNEMTTVWAKKCLLDSQ